MRKSALLLGTILALGAVAPAAAQTETAQPANATTPQDAEDDSPAEIVVTAQKRSERLQDVPVAVSVVSGSALASLSRPSIESATQLVPSLNVLKSGTSLNQTIFLRGVGTATFSIAGEPSVSTVVDGVVYARSGEAFTDLVDIDQMEVLRGPQGTLFGKNASAGLINITTRRPTATAGGSLEAGYFSGGEHRIRGIINAPLSSDVLTRVTAFYAAYDGNIRNITTGDDVNGYKRYGIRGQLLFQPAGSSLRVLLIGDYYKNNDDCCAEVIGTPPIAGATGLPTTSIISAALPTPRGDETREIAQNLVTRTRERGAGVSAQIDLDVGEHTLTSISAYRDWKNTEIRDGDFLPRAYSGFNQLHDTGPQVSNTLSQEVRLTSPGDQMFTYVLGGFISRAEADRVFTRENIVCNVTPALTALTPCGTAGAPASTLPGATARFGSVFDNAAVFGQGVFNVSDQLRLLAGLRYTRDKLEVYHSRNTRLAGPGIQPSFPATGTGTGQPATVFRARTSESNVSGKASIQYELTDDVMAYASYTRGYKGPAYNVFFNLNANGTNVIEPETVNSYELGLKNSLMNGRLVLNLTAFSARYKNFQANNPDVVAGVVVTRFTNAGTVSTKGAELDLYYQPVRDLTFSGGLAYTDAQVERFRLPPGALPTQVVPPGTPLAFAPKWKGSLSADYRFRDLGTLDLWLGGSVNSQSKQISQFSPDPIVRRLTTIDGYTLANLSAGISDDADTWRVTFQVRNLFDLSFASAIQSGGPAGSYRYQISRDADRYFGVTGRVNFGGSRR
jgi:iron complex outermembrane receptor protein